MSIHTWSKRIRVPSFQQELSNHLKSGLLCIIILFPYKILFGDNCQISKLENIILMVEKIAKLYIMEKNSGIFPTGFARTGSQ
jgi:hypothetical protein